MKQTLEILRLISECIRFDHPIVLDIRYYFHLLVSDMYGIEPWATREKWEKVIKGCPYTLRSFLKSFRQDANFRQQIIVVLELEVSRLKEAEE